MIDNNDKSLQAVLIDEIKLVLEEKRAALELMRTGILILLAQLGIFCFLIVDSRYYQLLEVLHLAIPFLVVNAGLLSLGLYLIVHAFKRIRHCDQLIGQMKNNRSFGQYLD